MKMKILYAILTFPFMVYSQVAPPTESGSFVYEDCSCSVRIDMRIYNGLIHPYGGGIVSQVEETNPGAVTVANLNDTDGDSMVDVNDWSVFNLDPSQISGRNEVDLMRLDIKSTGRRVDSCPFLELDVEGPALLWQNPTKDFPQYPIISISDLPKTIYIEATNASYSVRDIVIEAKVEGEVKDVVKATSVWVDLVKKYKLKTLALPENPSSVDLEIDQAILAMFLDNFMPDNVGRRYGLGEVNFYKTKKLFNAL